MSVGIRIKERREQLSLTQTELAEMIGVTKGAIGNYESGVSKPRESILVQLCEALKVDPNYLYQDSFPKQKSPPPENGEELKKELYDLVNLLSSNQIEELISYVNYLIWKAEQS